MITLAQRITELRTQKGMSRPELSLALGLPKTAVEKFETGRQTPTQEQQKKMAAYFGVSLFYLRGESNDPTTQDSWMNGAIPDDDDPAPNLPVMGTDSRPVRETVLVRRQPFKVATVFDVSQTEGKELPSGPLAPELPGDMDAG